MRILHTADLHFGQQIYQHYDRLDEHLHFFDQLKGWIRKHEPDVLIISGDIFDVAQPAASVWSAFNSQIVEIRRNFPDLSIVMVAGNHDSASRLESYAKIWDIAGVTVIGTPPPLLQSASEGWEERYVVRIPAGYVIALPYMSGDRTDCMIHLQEYVANINSEKLPVVMTGHLAAVGSDTEGHNPDIGNIRSVSIENFGNGYDYLALGHIHKPQTLGKELVFDDKPSSYPSPVARYSGSVLHVSEDENYPHSVCLVDIETHGSDVTISQLRIDELRHFTTLPEDATEHFENAKGAISYLKKYLKDKNNDKVYIRLRFTRDADIPSDFNATVYSLIEQSGKDVRYNPRMIFVSKAEEESEITNRPKLEVEEIQQMTNPLEFVRKTADAYPGLTDEDLENLFDEVEKELRKMNDN